MLLIFDASLLLIFFKTGACSRLTVQSDHFEGYQLTLDETVTIFFSVDDKLIPGTIQVLLPIFEIYAQVIGKYFNRGLLFHGALFRMPHGLILLVLFLYFLNLTLYGLVDWVNLRISVLHSSNEQVAGLVVAVDGHDAVRSKVCNCL